MIRTVTAIVFLAVPAASFAAKANVDHLAVAAVLLKDNEPGRALRVLRNVSPKKQPAKAKRYYTLSGLAHLKQKGYPEAVTAFKQALATHSKSTKETPAQRETLWLLLAQSAFGARKFATAVEALGHVKQARIRSARVDILHAESLSRLGRTAAAYNVYRAALGRHTNAIALRRGVVLTLIKLGLYQQANSQARALLGNRKAGLRDAVLVGAALRKAGAKRTAAEVLEAAMARYGWQPKLVRLLGRTYLDLGQPLAAATLYQRIVAAQPKLNNELAELYRRAGQLELALSVNSQVRDQRVKIRQRLGLLVDAQRFEEVAALEPRLVRLELAKDEAIRYALAYANLQIGRFDAAIRLARSIKIGSYFERTVALRRAATVCRSRPLECI